MAFEFLETFGKAFIPQKFRPYIRHYMMKAGIADVPYKLFGGLFYLSLLLTFVIYMFILYPILTAEGVTTIELLILTFVFWFVVQITIALIIMSVIYFYLDMQIYKRTKDMESVLIEFLRFVSENLKGGMNFDKALWNSVKPQFSVLANEIRIASKKAMTGEDVEETLVEFTEKYNSPMLKRAFGLVIESMKGGGEVVDVIDRVIANLEETSQLKEEMSATALSYVIFVSFIVIVVAPGLFALSKQLLIILGSFAERLGTSLTGAASTLPISFSNVVITPEQFKTFSFGSLGIISGFASMVISIIRYGEIKGGLKHIPFYIASSLLLYYLFDIILAAVMKGVFGL